MGRIEHVIVAVQDDFIEKQTRSRPIAALAELIWNSLDGGACRVTVEYEDNDLGGLSKIAVHDDGAGFSRAEAPTLFGNLGGSWKRHTRHTRTKNRLVHGQEGRGRYKAFALGQSVEWKVCYLHDDGEPRAFEIRILDSNLKDVAITDERREVGRKTGVIVEIADTKKNVRALFSDERVQELAEAFALYLIGYKNVTVQIGEQSLRPEATISHETTFTLPSIECEDGTEYPVELHLIEWQSEGLRTLYLCSADGFPIDRVDTRFHVPGFSFSAYIKSKYVDLLHNDGQLSLAGLTPALRISVELARTTIKEHFRARASHQACRVVEAWKRDKVYPFIGEPASPVEKAERQVFDIVAVSVQDYSPDLATITRKTQQLHLRMLRHAIERGPNDLQAILQEVLDLPARKQKELADLLQETTLSAIITAAKTVADRLKFISGLENIVFGKETKERLKERSQLHKIIAESTWIFGEQYNLWVSDRSLRKVLEKHKSILDPEIAIDDPISVSGKKRAIVDLMLSRSTRRHRSNDIENLVVELKAPRVSIGEKEIAQAKRYAIAVTKDERFHTVKGVRWHFWIVSNNYTDYARHDIDGGPDPDRRLIFRKGEVSVGIKTWAELIEENRARLQFFQEHLQHSADDSTAVRFLKERHRDYLEGVAIDEDINPADALV